MSHLLSTTRARHHLISSHLIACGWNWNNIKHIFNDTHNHISSKSQAKQKHYQGQLLFMHAEYHPRGLKQFDLNNISKTTLSTNIPNQTNIALF